jgi:hypothetical protein
MMKWIIGSAGRSSSGSSSGGGGYAKLISIGGWGLWWTSPIRSGHCLSSSSTINRPGNVDWSLAEDYKGNHPRYKALDHSLTMERIQNSLLGISQLKVVDSFTRLFRLPHQDFQSGGCDAVKPTQQNCFIPPVLLLLLLLLLLIFGIIDRHGFMDAGMSGR